MRIRLRTCHELDSGTRYAVDHRVDYLVHAFTRQTAYVLALPGKFAAVRELKSVEQLFVGVGLHLRKISGSVVVCEGQQLTALDAGDVGHLGIGKSCGLQKVRIQCVIPQAFYPVALTVLLPVSSAYLFTPVGCRGLVEGLYRFTLYALPLTTVAVAFGSDWHLSLPVSFRDFH